MKKQTENFPLVRFKGFSDAWEQRKLGEHTTLITKGTTPKDRSSKGNINFVKVENVFNGKIFPVTQISKEEHEKYLKRSKLEADDILFSIAGTLGRTAIVRESILPANTNQALAIIRGYDFNTNFLITSLSGHVVAKFIRKNPTIGAQPNLSLEQVGNLMINSPSKYEQQEIGTFFKQLDDTIALHQRKLDALKQMKKGFLQQLFPKNGEKVPKVRFANFEEKWMECKLGEIADIYDGTHQTPKYTESGVKFVSVENVTTLETKKYISQEAYEKEYSKKQAKKGDVLMTRIGDIGTSRVIETDVVLAYYVTLALLKPKSTDSNFLAWQIASPEVQRDIWKRTLHIAFPKKINLGEINQVNVFVPIKKEQQKIGTYFKQLDKTIAIHQKKLDKLKLLKKAYLQNMFI